VQALWRRLLHLLRLHRVGATATGVNYPAPLGWGFLAIIPPGGNKSTGSTTLIPRL